MNKDQVRESVLSKHEPGSQRAFAVDAAIGQVFGGLDELLKYGHVFHLEEGSEHEPQAWPKMMYRDGSDGKGQDQRIVNDEQEAKDLGEGWRDTPLKSGPEAPDEIGKITSQETADHVRSDGRGPQLAKPGDAIDGKNTNPGDSKKR